MPIFDASWLPRALFRLTLAVAAGLVVFVIVSPLLHNYLSSRLIAVFAEEVSVRRTALASAVGLAVTACIFFRPAPAPTRPAPKPRGKLPPPPDLAGA
jgi:uncharacterized membrane protein